MPLSSAWTVMNRIGDVSNSEVQCYDPANVTVANSWLTITAKAQSKTCNDTNMNGSVRNGPTANSYTSGMIQTASFNFTFGTLEFKAKMPNFPGAWPGSLWLLGGSAGGNTGCQLSNPHSADNIGTCNWPADTSDSGEIDIAEFLGSVTTCGQNTFTGSSFTSNTSVSDASVNWHVYKLVWTSGRLSWFVDGVQTNTTTSPVPQHPMFIIINLAMGGAGGTVTGSGLPAQLLVDYVSVLDSGNNQIFFDDFLDPVTPPSLTLAACGSPSVVGGGSSARLIS